MCRGHPGRVERTGSCGAARAVRQHRPDVGERLAARHQGRSRGDIGPVETPRPVGGGRAAEEFHKAVHRLAVEEIDQLKVQTQFRAEPAYESGDLLVADHLTPEAVVRVLEGRLWLQP